MKTGTKRFAGIAIMLAAGALLGGCSVPKFLQEPFEKGVYEDIMERQAQGVPVEEDTLKNLPSMTAADYEKLGDTYLTRGQMGLARSKYQKALELHPGDWKLEYKIGTVYLRQDMPGEALPYFQSMTRHDPSNSRGWEGEGRALLATKDHEGAEAALKKAVRLESGNWKAQQALGMLYDDLGRPDDAIVAYKAALRVRPVEASILNNLGVAYYLKKDYPQSIETLEKALRTARPEDRRRVYNNLGRAYARSGQYPRAVDSFRRGSELAVAYNNVGIVLLEQDKPSEAAGCFEKAMKVSTHFYAAAQENLVIARDRAKAGGSGRGETACP
ncbi:MAG TPA: tetratricopeptide repeat protein [Candidatus Limnocylindrales bacterium]|nr:tetratricopeptide repeat protein [Candidatus Limnocylindrales bacterium]